MSIQPRYKSWHGEQDIIVSNQEAQSKATQRGWSLDDVAPVKLIKGVEVES